MDVNLELVAIATIPALIVGGVAYFGISSMVKNEALKQKYYLLKHNQKEVLPLKLQAFERLTLFLDRISIQKLLVRVSPVSEDVSDYKNLLIATIDQEFEHNLAQQIYVSEDSWKAILAAKNTVIAQLHKLSESDAIENASSYRKQALVDFAQSNSSTVAQSILRSEVRELFR